MSTTPRADIVHRQRGIENNRPPPLKIVVTGPFAAGKTTFIKSVSEVSVLATERDVTDASGRIKSQTTVAMDFGRITFDEDLTLFLFGTPGQRRFEMMWEILSEGMIGFVLLVHAGDGRSVQEAREILATFRRYADVPYVVGVSHLDQVEDSDDEVLEKVKQVLELPASEVSSCDPRDKEDVKRLLLQILLGVLGRVERAAAAEAD